MAEGLVESICGTDAKSALRSNQAKYENLMTHGIHAYSLMGNHDHLAIETPQGNLEAGFDAMSRGWALGGKDFKTELLKEHRERFGAYGPRRG